MSDLREEVLGWLRARHAAETLEAHAKDEYGVRAWYAAVDAVLESPEHPWIDPGEDANPGDVGQIRVETKRGYDAHKVARDLSEAFTQVRDGFNPADLSPSTAPPLSVARIEVVPPLDFPVDSQGRMTLQGMSPHPESTSPAEQTNVWRADCDRMDCDATVETLVAADLSPAQQREQATGLFEPMGWTISGTDPVVVSCPAHAPGLSDQPRQPGDQPPPGPVLAYNRFVAECTAHACPQIIAIQVPADWAYDTQRREARADFTVKGWQVPQSDTDTTVILCPNHVGGDHGNHSHQH